MSESSGAHDASTLVLRISVPDGAEYQEIVKELAAKVAAYLGDTDPEGRAATDALDQVTQGVKTRSDHHGSAHGSNNEELIFEFRQSSDALLIRARRAGQSADVRRPLPS